MVPPDESIQETNEHVFSDAFFEPFIRCQSPSGGSEWDYIPPTRSTGFVTGKCHFGSFLELRKVLAPHSEEKYPQIGR